jgi:tight adherence protein C
MILLLDFLVFFSAAWLIHHFFRAGYRWELKPVDLQPLHLLISNSALFPFHAWLERKIITACWKVRPDQFLALQILSGIGLMIGGTLFMTFMQSGWGSVHLLIFNISFFFITGVFLPLLKLINDVQERQKNMVRDLSFYLDLMTLGVEAGLDYLNVLKKVLGNARPGPLKEEFETMIGQIQMGKSRSEAWREFSDRIDLPEIRSLVLALIQTDQTGSPLSGMLRGLSQDMKAQRFQLAEKRAYQMPVKMLVPLLGCIFPAVFILIFEPLVLRFLHLL